MAILEAAVVFFMVAGLGTYFVIIFNSLVRLRNNIDKAWANLDVLLKQRHDELLRLIDACKGYMQYEQRILQAVTVARGAYARAGSIREKAAADGQVSGSLRNRFTVAEKYPELRANRNFEQLEQQITSIEKEIADRREFLNDSELLQHADPAIARSFRGYTAGVEPKPLFQASDKDRRDVEVELA